MELKWIMIAAAVIMGMAMVSIAVSEYGKGQCKVAAIQTGKYSGQEIERMCR